MDKKMITKIDGSIEEREQIMKDFFGLRPDQTFQDLEVEDNEE
jgi:hypothetical protein